MLTRYKLTQKFFDDAKYEWYPETEIYRINDNTYFDLLLRKCSNAFVHQVSEEELEWMTKTAQLITNLEHLSKIDRDVFIKFFFSTEYLDYTVCLDSGVEFVKNGSFKPNLSNNQYKKSIFGIKDGGLYYLCLAYDFISKNEIEYSKTIFSEKTIEPTLKRLIDELITLNYIEVEAYNPATPSSDCEVF